MEPRADQEPGLRARKAALLRDELARVALIEFERRGFDAVTVDEVAAAAGVSRRTFFRYYPTKESVVFPRHGARLAAFRRALAEGRGSSPFDVVRHALAEVGRDYQARRREVISQHRVIEATPSLVARELELDREWEAAIADAVGAGARASGREARRRRAFAGAAVGALRVAFREWFASDGRADLVELGLEVLALVERGFAPRREGTSDRGRA